MMKGANRYFLKGLFFFLLVFFAKSVNAVVYFGQTYTGFGVGGIYFNDLQSLYYAYPGWIDFILFLFIFTGISKAVFAKRFKDSEGAANGLAASLGIALSLGLVLWEGATGVFILKDMIILAVGLAFIGIFVALYIAFKKFMKASPGFAFILSLIATYLLWSAAARYVGLGSGDFANYMFDNFNADFANVITYALGGALLLGLLGVLYSFFKHTKGSGDSDDGNRNDDERRSGGRKPGIFRRAWNGLFRRGDTNPTDPNASGLNENNLTQTQSNGGGSLGGGPQINCDLLKVLISRVQYLIKSREKVAVLVDGWRAEINKLRIEIEKRESSEDVVTLNGGLNDVNSKLKSLSLVLRTKGTTLRGFLGIHSWPRNINFEIGKVCSSLKDVRPYRSYLGNLGNAYAKICIAFDKNARYSGGDQGIRLAKCIYVLKDLSVRSGIQFDKPLLDMNCNELHDFLVRLWNFKGCGTAGTTTPSSGTATRSSNGGTPPGAPPGPALYDFDAVMTILDGGISLPEPRLFSLRGRRKFLNISKFATMIIFSDTSELREQIEDRIPEAFIKFKNLMQFLERSGYHNRNPRLYDEFKGFFDNIERDKGNVLRISEHAKINRFENYAKAIYNELVTDTEFINVYNSFFGGENFKTVGWKYVFLDESRLKFMFSNSQNPHLAKMYNYFDIAYDRLMDLNANFKGIRLVIKNIKKDLS